MRSRAQFRAHPIHPAAQSGKWKGASLDAEPGARVAVAASDELKPDQMKLLRVGDHRIALARTADGHCAFDDRCPHRGASLAGAS